VTDPNGSHDYDATGRPMSYSTIDEEDPFARAEMLPAYLPAYTAGGDGGYADEKEKDGPPPDVDGGYGIGFGHTQ
jgi:hypothetical protein